MLKLESSFLNDLQKWRPKEEVLWWQRSRVNFLKFGDKNSAWFHTGANVRRATNMILELKDVDGALYSSMEELDRIIGNFLSSLFSLSSPPKMDQVVKLIPYKVTSAMNERIGRPYSTDKIFAVLNQMHLGKFPGPDGLNPFFC